MICNCLHEVNYFSLFLFYFSTGELHIFQCNSHSAQQVVDDLNHWMRRHGNTAGASEVNVNVKETVHVFNAIAAQRETYVLLHRNCLAKLTFTLTPSIYIFFILLK